MFKLLKWMANSQVFVLKHVRLACLLACKTRLFKLAKRLYITNAFEYNFFYNFISSDYYIYFIRFIGIY